MGFEQIDRFRCDAPGCAATHEQAGDSGLMSPIRPRSVSGCADISLRGSEIWCGWLCDACADKMQAALVAAVAPFGEGSDVG